MIRPSAVTARTWTYSVALAVLGLAVLIPAYIAARQGEAADARRLIEALALEPGVTVAEVGAGDGDLTLAVATHLGANGRVFTTELGAERVEALRKGVAKAPAGNVEVLEGHDSRTNLPATCCDAIFMRAVYHHFGQPQTMNASLLEALKPGGRLAVIDFEPSGEASEDPSQRAAGGAHGVRPEDVTRELAGAGFDVLRTERLDGRRFLILARKPA